MGSKNLSKHECGLKRPRQSRLQENPKTIGSLNPQFHLLHSSAPSSGRSRILNPVRRTSVRQPHMGQRRAPEAPRAGAPEAPQGTGRANRGPPPGRTGGVGVSVPNHKPRTAQACEFEAASTGHPWGTRPPAGEWGCRLQKLRMDPPHRADRTAPPQVRCLTGIPPVTAEFKLKKIIT